VDAVSEPYDGARSIANGSVIKIIECEVEDDVSIFNRLDNLGKVIRSEENTPIVVCGDGLLKIVKMEDLDGNQFSIPKFRSRFTNLII
jgi:methionyl-tRNA formyltransferase